MEWAGIFAAHDPGWGSAGGAKHRRSAMPASLNCSSLAKAFLSLMALLLLPAATQPFSGEAR
jgi:hypothetical protein